MTDPQHSWGHLAEVFSRVYFLTDASVSVSSEEGDEEEPIISDQGTCIRPASYMTKSHFRIMTGYLIQK